MEKENKYSAPEIRIFLVEVERGFYASSGNPKPGDDSDFEWG